MQQIDEVTGTVSEHNKKPINVNDIFVTILFTKQLPQNSVKQEISFNIII